MPVIVQHHMDEVVGEVCERTQGRGLNLIYRDQRERFMSQILFAYDTNKTFQSPIMKYKSFNSYLSIKNILKKN